MAEILTHLPGLKPNRIHKVITSKSATTTAELIHRYSSTYSFSIFYVSLNCNSSEILTLLPEKKTVGKILALDQKNPTPKVIARKAWTAMSKRFARFVIIDGAERLPDDEKELQWLNFGSIPTILIYDSTTL